MNYVEIDYDEHANLLYKLSGQLTELKIMTRNN